jgi:hypothetical protein
MDRVEYQPIVIQDLLNMHKSDELDLNPWYQRRSVWNEPQKSYLINTIFEKKPIPSIYIRHYLDVEKEKSIKEIVDGQQRIRAILEYVADDYSSRHPKYKKRVNYSELHINDKKAFKMTSLSVGYLIEADDTDVVEIFGRLNSVAKTLNPQEKRNAKFSGEMKQFCLKVAAAHVNLWRKFEIFSANDIARMQEVQLVSDLVFNLLHGLSDYSAAKLDELYSIYDEEFDGMNDVEERMELIFEKIASLNAEAISDTIFSRPPLFFSLFIVLAESKRNIPCRILEDSLYRMDKIFNADIPISERKQEEANFLISCTSSTQRIKSRQIRHSYIKKHVGV